MQSAEVRRCLELVDVPAARLLWARIAPHLPQPRDDAEALATIHIARTHSKSIAFKLRAYSHRWVTERGLPSGLPDHLKPKAERIYPRIVHGVGLAVKTAPHRQDLGNAIHAAMKDAVMNCYADGETDGLFVRKRIREVRLKVLKGA